MNARLPAALLASLAAIASLTAQEPASEDWDDAVRKAAEHPRFALRRAAAGKIAQAGDAAIPAIRAYEREAGRAGVPLLLVDAIATSGVSGPATENLLEAWAKDLEFYWRAQALGGLAQRRIGRLLPLFRRAVDDASHLYRIEGARGLLAVGEGPADELRVRALLADPDPRARLRVALMLLEHGDSAGVGELVAAVDGADRAFIDDPWGSREAVFALRELRRITDQDFTAALGEAGDAQRAAREAIDAWAREVRPDWEPGKRRTRPFDAVGGVEIRSCRNGDLFVRWQADGTFLLGLDPVRSVRVTGDDFATLRARLPTLAGTAIHGTIICDFVRLVVPATVGGDGVEIHHKAAPAALPEPLHEWLKALAVALDESGEGAQLRGRLGQFATSEKDR